MSQTKKKEPAFTWALFYLRIAIWSHTLRGNVIGLQVAISQPKHRTHYSPGSQSDTTQGLKWHGANGAGAQRADPSWIRNNLIWPTHPTPATQSTVQRSFTLYWMNHIWTRMTTKSWHSEKYKIEYNKLLTNKPLLTRLMIKCQTSDVSHKWRHGRVFEERGPDDCGWRTRMGKCRSKSADWKKKKKIYIYIYVYIYVLR